MKANRCERTTRSRRRVPIGSVLLLLVLLGAGVTRAEDPETRGAVTHWTVGDVRLKMRRNPNGTADFHAAFEQSQQTSDWARQNQACTYLALAVRARDEEGFPFFSLDLVCPALATAETGATIDCDGFAYRAPRVSEPTRLDANLAGRGCP